MKSEDTEDSMCSLGSPFNNTSVTSGCYLQICVTITQPDMKAVLQALAKLLAALLQKQMTGQLFSKQCWAGTNEPMHPDSVIIPSMFLYRDSSRCKQEDCDQPAQMCRLIQVFTVCI